MPPLFNASGILYEILSLFLIPIMGNLGDGCESKNLSFQVSKNKK